MLIIGNRLANERTMSDAQNEQIKSLNDSESDIRFASKRRQSPPLPTATTSASASRQEFHDDAQLVDFASSFLFPLSFIIFNIIYWVVYLNMQVESSN